MIPVIVALFMDTSKLVHGERHTSFYNVTNLEVRRSKQKRGGHSFVKQTYIES